MADQSLMDRALGVVNSYLSRNDLAADKVPAFIKSVYESIIGAETAPEGTTNGQAPHVPIEESVDPKGEFIVCLEDGMKLKTLKRHLASAFNMTVDEYLRKWNLPHGYPVVAPAYAAQRSQMARKLGLGRTGRGGKPLAPTKVSRGALKKAPARKSARKKTA